MIKIQKSDLNVTLLSGDYHIVTKKDDRLFKVNVEKSRGYRNMVYIHSIGSVKEEIVLTPLLMEFIDFYAISEETDPEYFI